nr:MAG TPA: hypothetical protein [Caudoviricetes sp.]
MKAGIRNGYPLFFCEKLLTYGAPYAILYLERRWKE